MASPGRPKKEVHTKPERRQMASDEYVSQFYIDPSNLDTDNYHYRWVETHCLNAETQSLNNALRAGYEPVPLSEVQDFRKTAELISSIRGREQKDDFVRQGDQILMRCPRALYERARKTERLDAKRQASRLEWAGQSAAIKAPTFVAANEYSRTHESSKAFADDDE